MSLPPLRVLLVDDEERVRHSLSRLLSHRLCSDREVAIDAAADVGAAVARLEQSRYDLVLTDYRMPGRTGVELLAIVAERWPGTHRVLLSGFGDIEDRLSPASREAVECVVHKPWESAPLLNTLRGIVGQ